MTVTDEVSGRVEVHLGSSPPKIGVAEGVVRETEAWRGLTASRDVRGFAAECVMLSLVVMIRALVHPWFRRCAGLYGTDSVAGMKAASTGRRR